jgi:hypothetical protein
VRSIFPISHQVASASYLARGRSSPNYPLHKAIPKAALEAPFLRYPAQGGPKPSEQTNTREQTRLQMLAQFLLTARVSSYCLSAPAS